jgi:hypothetical protein
MHLLVTDPSTSPRTPLGRAVFGVLYGLGVFGLYALLGAMGLPTFYDKLMMVPLLNLLVRPSTARWWRGWASSPSRGGSGLVGPLADEPGTWRMDPVLRRDDGPADRRHAPR